MGAPNKLRVVDLFSGCGGLTEGVIRAAREFNREMEIALAVDLDRSAIEVYAKNFRNISNAISCGEIEGFFDVSRGDRSLVGKERRLASQFGRVDVIVAGPPCQGHSSLNNVSRGSDPRNNLYWAPVRAAMVFRPRVVLIENVPGVAKSQERVIDGAHACLTKMGYCVSGGNIRLSSLGVPQQRKRHVLLAVDGKFDLPGFMAARVPNAEEGVMSAISDIVDLAGPEMGPFNRTTRLSKENKARIDYLFDMDVYDLPNELRPACHRDKDHSYISMYGRIYPDKPAQTITGGFGSMGQGRFVHPTRRRMITAHEAARIQGFDDRFDFTSAPDMSSLRRMIGNAAPPALSGALLSELVRRALV